MDQKGNIVEWFVEIVNYANGKVVKKLGPYPSERMALRADGGVNINLEHSEFYTRISSPQPSIPQPRTDEQKE